MAASGLDQFLGVFLDEADEHLATVETLLLGLENQQPDAEDQNAIFRAAHSIKGGAATFGLPDVAELMHEVESLLDEVRHGERALDRVLFELVLEAVDVIKLMLTDYRQHGRCLAPHGVMLLPRLRDLLGNAVPMRRWCVPARKTKARPAAPWWHRPAKASTSLLYSNYLGIFATAVCCRRITPTSLS